MARPRRGHPAPGRRWAGAVAHRAACHATRRADGVHRNGPAVELPAYLRAMDAASCWRPRRLAFHYSPLKLAEYLAAAVPVVAPAVGQLSERLTDGVDALLVPPHDVAGARRPPCKRLQSDADERARIGRAGHRWPAQPGRGTNRCAASSPPCPGDLSCVRCSSRVPGCVGRTPIADRCHYVRAVDQKREDSGLLSVVVVVHDMARELPRTLRSLSPRHQIGLAADDYEVIVVDNGSADPGRSRARRAFGATAARRADRPGASVAGPCRQRSASRLAEGDLVGLIVDGARLASPGLLAGALRAARLADRPVITAPAFHLGEVPHMRAAEVGYDQAVEDELLAGSRLGGRRLSALRDQHPGGIVGSRAVRADGREQQPVLPAGDVAGARRPRRALRAPRRRVGEPRPLPPSLCAPGVGARSCCSARAPSTSTTAARPRRDGTRGTRCTPTTRRSAASRTTRPPPRRCTWGTQLSAALPYIERSARQALDRIATAGRVAARRTATMPIPGREDRPLAGWTDAAKGSAGADRDHRDAPVGHVDDHSRPA